MVTPPLISTGAAGIKVVSVVVVVLPRMQAEFQASRSSASMAYTATMLGYCMGDVVMGRLDDPFRHNRSAADGFNQCWVCHGQQEKGLYRCAWTLHLHYG